MFLVPQLRWWMLQPCILWLACQLCQVVADLVDSDSRMWVSESNTISSCMAVAVAHGVRF